MTRSITLLLACAIAASAANASDFPGQYADETGMGVTLTLQSTEEEGYAGYLSMDGADVSLAGETEDDVLLGEMDDGMTTIAFRAHFEGTTLIVDMMSPDYPEEIATSLRFRRAGSTVDEQSPNTVAGDVVINGEVLSAKQIGELENTYGVKPLPGNYWYDAMSGLYGVVGYQAFGYMYPGHDFAEMHAGVSRGNTNVFVNGRELPESEWLIWSYMLGSPIQMGAYWLDAQGNAGYVGNPLPTVNLYAAAMQNAYQGQGGSGDNFWSTRFSAGNSNADNTQGYVSVPGHGPVGYGF